MDAQSASAVFPIPYQRSCKKETDKPIEGELIGEIPKWLKGNLIRIGSGLLEVGPDKYNHVFDGLALMHRFNFDEGKVTYQNRFLRSDAFKKNMKANRVVVSEFATRGTAPDPCKTIFQRFVSLFNLDEMTDNDLINVILYGEEAYACSETNNVWKIDPDSLDSVQKVNIRNYVPVNAAIAHAHEDEDGTVYNIGSTFIGLKPTYNVLKFPPKENKESSPFENGTVLCKVPSSKYLNLSYYHSFGMSEKYFILVEQPLYLYMPGMIWSHYISGTYADAMHWDQKAQTKFHIIRRSDGCLLDCVYVAKAFFVFHHINAYEEDDHLIVDMCCYDDGVVVKKMYVKALEDMFNNSKPVVSLFTSNARRYVLPLKTHSGSEEENHNLVTLTMTEACAHRQSDGSIFLKPENLTGKEFWSPELPRINYKKYNGKKYKYFYAMGRNDKSEKAQLLKVDTESKTVVSWSETDAIPSESIFLENPDEKCVDEDSGVLLASLLYKNDEKKVSMIVLDAKTMTEVGRVTFIANSSVPADFHGTFITKS